LIPALYRYLIFSILNPLYYGGGSSMFELTVIMDFAAAHRLVDYDGQCSNIHGHTWQVEACVASNTLNEAGMVMDFKDLKTALSSIIEKYDHCCLNDVPPFNLINPTAENIARQIYVLMKPLCFPVRLTSIKVWESDSSNAIYRED
jgi:6-pyruvoyltetrahydropterin/6-carboxytetrahydropterin synthase